MAAQLSDAQTARSALVRKLAAAKRASAAVVLSPTRPSAVSPARSCEDSELSMADTTPQRAANGTSVGGEAVTARLRVVHRTLSWRTGDAFLSARAANGTGISQRITAEQAVNGHVLSGARRLVLSGAPVSCYQARKSQVSSRTERVFPVLNLVSNLQSYLTNNNKQLLQRWITANSQQPMRFPGRSWGRFPTGRVMP